MMNGDVLYMQYIFTRSVPASVSAIQGCSLDRTGGALSYEK